jgi:6-pyruvoyltetrahydropterin/6-carboxytetrahydropterin synthase
MKITLTRRYLFSASHRLHSARFSDAENDRLYGKCNHPHGHGHNYFVEVTVSGATNPDTGMIANLTDLDAFVRERVLEPLDHTYLNEQAPEFLEVVPTTENLCLSIFRRLQDFPHARLERIRIEETGLNSFEYFREAAQTFQGAVPS